MSLARFECLKIASLSFVVAPTMLGNTSKGAIQD